MTNSQKSPNVELDITGLPDSVALEQIGLLIDASSDAQSTSGTDRAFILLDEIQNRPLTPKTAALTHYLRANAWENKRRAKSSLDAWAFEQPELQAQILSLRQALTHEGFCQLHPIYQCAILTNLANQLNSIGRFIEAIELWDRALALDGKAGMARGNRGSGLSRYAYALYDGGHTCFMLLAAYDGLMSAVAEDGFYPSADYAPSRTFFEKEAQRIATLGDFGTFRQHVVSRQYSLGRSSAEKHYRTWCLQNRLFVNPLNDLGPLPIAAHDVLTLPSITEPTPSIRPPAIFGFFNQMKQEFTSARYLYYDGVHAKGVHFSDRGVLLYNTLDYPAYSLANEKMRAAFRLAYSIFNKVGFFLNEYFSLEHDPRAISFRSVWYKDKKKKTLRQQIKDRKNWPLRGLFWLSKDLFEENFKSFIQPDAKELNEIRNHLEHKYLQLHQGWLGGINGPDATERLGYDLTVDTFAAKTLRVLTMARAALIYLSLAVHREENSRTKITDKNRIIPIGNWSDDWKQ